MTWILPLLASVLAAFFFSVVSLSVAAISAPVEQGDMVLVMSYPWGPTPADILKKSNLVERFPESAPMGSFTQIETDTDPARLKTNGAWFVLHGDRLAELCSR